MLKCYFLGQGWEVHAQLHVCSCTYTPNPSPTQDSSDGGERGDSRNQHPRLQTVPALERLKGLRMTSHPLDENKSDPNTTLHPALTAKILINIQREKLRIAVFYFFAVSG